MSSPASGSETRRPAARDPAGGRGHWADSLFARVFLLQVVVALLLVALLTLVLFADAASVFARAALPSWSAALQPVAAQWARGETPNLPQGIDVLVEVDLVPGPPPADARWIEPGLMVPRYAALRDGLQARGIPVRRMAVSEATDPPLTWLELSAPGRTPLWVGLRGALENPRLRLRGAAGLGLALLVFLAAAAWLSRRVTRPLQQLQRRVDAFAETGCIPPPQAPHGPLEVRCLAARFDALVERRVQQDDARAMMLAGISHDLRSPLGRIRLAAELLPDAPGVAVRREAIVRNARLADELVGAFIAYVRSASEPLDERVDLHALVRERLDDADQAGVQARLPAPGRALWVAPASRIGLQRCLANLLDNAHRHGRPPLELSLRVEGDELRLTVRDHGPGIAADQRALLLQPFQRGAADRGQPGTGLGLAVVDRTVRRHGGRLQLEDAAPGLRAVLCLPCADPGETPVAPAADDRQE